MKIGICSSLPLYETDVGGVEQHILGLKQVLRQRGHDIQISYAKRFTKTKSDKIFSIPFNLQNMADCDIIHIHGTTLGYLALILGKPTVLTYHGVMQPELESGVKNKIIAYVDNVVVKRISGKVHARIAVSSFVKRWIKEKFRVNAQVIPNAIFPDEYDPTPLSHSKPSILFVGRLVPYKGVEYLIRAMKFVVRNFPDVELVIRGSGSEKAHLVSLVNALKIQRNVCFVGKIFREELAFLYRRADIVVLPSLNETFGIVTLEAMAHEKPFVGTRAGALPEIVQDNHTGYLVPPQNPDALAEKICELLGDAQLRQRLGRNGRKIVERKYNWRVVVQLIEKVYERAIENWRRVAR